MVFVSVYKKKIQRDQDASNEYTYDFIILFYHHAVTLTRFGLKKTTNGKEIDCCKQEEAMVLDPFMIVWWIDNGRKEMFYGLNSLIPGEDQLFVEHLTPRWMLHPEISTIITVLNLNSATQFSSKIHLGFLTLELTYRGFLKVKEEAECKIDYDRVMAARKHMIVIEGEQQLHDTITRVIRKYENLGQFHFWASKTPPQIRDVELH
jgi:hypothetical protein